MRYIVALLAVMVLACNSNDSEKTAAPMPKSLPTAEQIWTWPEGAGHARDLSEDDEACRRQNQDVEPPLARLGAHRDCMLAKGWQLIPRNK